MTMQGGASGDPGAGAGSGAPAGGAPAAVVAPVGGAPPAPAWLEGVAPDLASYAGEQKLESVESTLMGHRGMMKLKGVPPDQLLRLEPGWDADPEKAAAVYARTGRPEKPDGYDLPAVQVGEGGFDLTPGYRTKAHELGLTARQAKGIAEWFTGRS